MTRTVADALLVFELVKRTGSRPPSGDRNETERVGLASGLMPNEAGQAAGRPVRTDRRPAPAGTHEGEPRRARQTKGVRAHPPCRPAVAEKG
ncbi:MAG: hypothetical protein U0871_14925 [Gemmataceae bacterium]